MDHWPFILPILKSKYMNVFVPKITYPIFSIKARREMRITGALFERDFTEKK